ncbi:hypothetical protein KI387_003777, partial [Taxus chinensis]
MHLEESIGRHKAHIVKLELILRLLDNDELSPEQVNDVKDFVEDYVERNQDDFEDFADVDELYNSLPLDKVEGLEDLVSIVPPSVVLKEKAVIAATAVVPSVNGTALKVSIASPSSQATNLPSPVSQQGNSTHEQADDTTSQEGNSDTRPLTPPSSTIANAGGSISSAASSGAASGPSVGFNSGLGGGSPVIARGLGGVSASALLAGSGSNRGVVETSTTVIPSSPIGLVNSGKEDDGSTFPVRRVTSELGLTRGVGRAPVVSGAVTSPATTLVPLNLSGAAHSGSGLGPDIAKRTSLAGDDRVGSSGLAQQLVPPLTGQGRVYLQQGAKLPDGTVANDSNSVSEGSLISTRIFNPSSVTGGQWRPPSASSFQNQTEMGQFRGRVEIAPDQRENYLQRLQQVQQVQQQGHNTALLGAQLSHLSVANQKQFSSQQQPTLLQQAQLQLLQQQHQQQGPLLQNSQSPSLQQQQVGLGLGLQSQSMSAVIPSSQHQQVQSSAAQSAAAQVLTTSMPAKENDVSSSKVEGQQPLQQQPQQKPVDDSHETTMVNTGFVRSFTTEDDLKNSYTFDVPVAGPGSLAELSQLSRDADLAPGQPVQPSLGHGVIGRRSNSDLGAIGDNLVGSISNAGAAHDNVYNLQMLDSAYHKLPQSKDSERLRSYVPRHPAITPASYPQVQLPLFDNPAFWEHLDTDTLFFAFYYQQNTYQQYLAARELKKQSWRYHRKYNTWFQRHEEPKVTTDDYEQGTYVYFDFNIMHEDYQHG